MYLHVARHGGAVAAHKHGAVLLQQQRRQRRALLPHEVLHIHLLRLQCRRV